MSSKIDAKLAVLSKIRDKKETLFGAFSSMLAKADKCNAWNEVHNLTTSLGLVSSSKAWSYTRDVFWPNIRKATLLKVDNAKKTGAAGGIKSRLNYLDEMVLEILGKDSPSVNGLGVSESLECESHVPTCTVTTLEENGPIFITDGDGSLYTSEERSDPPPRRGKKRYFRKDVETTDRHKALKIEKTELVIEQLRLANYKARLEIYKMEIELGLPRSIFTSSIPVSHEPASLTVDSQSGAVARYD